MRYLVIIRRTGTGYSVDVPDLSGCAATGTTVEHARQMISDAIEMHLELMQQSGETISVPSTSYEFAVDQDSDGELCTWVEVDELKTHVPS
jgi:predicted RNase H-like HicB family nuclease